MRPPFTSLILPLLFTASILSAQNAFYEDIYLKDGRALHGYISGQIIATGEVLINYSWKDFIRDDGSVASRETGGGQFLTKSSEIVKIVRPVFDEIYDLVTLRDGTKYKGHIVETIPGKSIRMLLDDGEIVILNQRDFVIQQRDAKDRSQSSIVAQSWFLEEYEIKNGSSFKGLLVSQDFASGALILVDTEGNAVAFLLNDVKKIRKAARPIVTITGDGERSVISLNGTGYISIKARQVNNNLFLPDGLVPSIVVKSGEWVVEMDNNPYLAQADPSLSPYNLFQYVREEVEGHYKLIPQRQSNQRVTIPPDSFEEGPVKTKYHYKDIPSGNYAYFYPMTRDLFLIQVK